MSEENVEIVRRSMEAVNEGDIDRAFSFADPGAELHSAIIGGAEGRTYRGLAGFRQWYTDAMESFTDLRTELTEFRDLGDRVLAFGRIRARGRESGLQLDQETGWVVTFRRGRVVKAEGFLSRAEAVQAAGLSE
jgi:ketosteroid isomerase-like protein